MFDVLDMVREGTWRAGVEGKNKRIDQMQKDGGMRLQNQIIQSLVEKNSNKMKTKMNIMHPNLLKTKKGFIHINEEDIIKIHVTNDTKPLSRFDDTLILEEETLRDSIIKSSRHLGIKETEPVLPDITEEPVKKASISSKKLLEVVQTRQGQWDRDLYILNPDQEVTQTIQKTFEEHGCSVQVGGLDRDLVYLYVLLNRKVSIKKLRRLMERGKKFGLEFFLTKTGLTSSLMARNLGKLFHQI